MKRALVFGLLLVLGVATPGTAATAKTKVTIKADLADGAGVRTWVLNCDGSGSNHPNRAAACALLKKKGTALFKPVPSGTICTELYGGSQQVSVTGVVARKKVSASFNRSNGCEISRYDAAEALFTIPNTQVFSGVLQLDGVPAAGPIVFSSGATTVGTKATASGFNVRLGLGTWIGSSGVGRCTPVTVVVPSTFAPLTISCTAPKS